MTNDEMADAESQPRRRSPDWESIEREFRAGVLTVREIGRRHAVSHTAIQKRAKAEKWQRDLTQRVREQVAATLVATTVATEKDGGNQSEDKRRTEREIVDNAAAAVVALVREHRTDLREGREMAASLLGQLRTAAGNRDALIAIIEDATGSEPGDSAAAKQRKEAQRKAMLAAVSLPSHVAVLRDLSNVLRNVIPLEREAFNMDATVPDERGDFASLLKEARERAMSAGQ